MFILYMSIKSWIALIGFFASTFVKSCAQFNILGLMLDGSHFDKFLNLF